MALRTLKRQHELCDILIQPDLKDFSPMSFAQADSMIARGEAAARKIMPQLQALVDSLGDRSGSGLSRNMSEINKLYITDLEFEGLNNVSNDLLSSKLQIKTSCAD